MSGDRGTTTSDPEFRLGEDFLDRLEASLDGAEHRRQRHDALEHAKRFLPILLLVGPIIAWRIFIVSAASAHVVIDMLAQLVFLLDVGVHLDTRILAYLHLQALPTVVGALLLLLVACSLLITRTGD